MATPLSADRMLAALRAEGVDVAEHKGWRTHNRNEAGPWGGVNGVLIHHTAGSNSLGLVWNGRSDLPGPLAHTHLAKDGTATMVGNGRANHAGKVARNAYDAVVNESATHPRPSSAGGTVDGNRHFYGIEIENLGNGRDPYPAVQYDQAVRWAAAICRAHGWSQHSVVGHKETSIEGKIDPSFGMTAFRAAVAERLAHPADWNPEDDMPQYVNVGISSEYTLAPGAWDSVEFTAEWSDEAGDHANDGSVWVRGACRFSGSLSLRVEGLTSGASVAVRMSEYEGDTLVVDHPVHGISGKGTVSAVVPLVKRIGAGRKMRIRLFTGQDSPRIVVSSAVLSALVWKEG
ncbi:N-acetylmuramoyl-L-alanine amidase [Streptomyces sp. NA04227]|uniref:N-acetylmuramoyl-L-alanine amidase n=1 Tax=Streptomyces sp. NA04227 TaxID=2742136 RepID=UPI001590C98C|nr:N-acetylmuramoyl-L-alanine amidase [Streptomyces sp. NA04227]QKW05057.1 N-acetylmuramoyl-L-alanine amidase [Streptomyces sp. NA04227]